MMRILLCLLILSSFIGVQLIGVCHAQIPDVTALIVQMRESKNIYQRRRAAKALGEIDAPSHEMREVAAALMAEVGRNPKDDSLGYYATEAFKQIKLSPEDLFAVWINTPSSAPVVVDKLAESAIPLLVQALNEQDADVRYAVAAVLYEFGPLAQQAVPALVKALKNPAQIDRGLPYRFRRPPFRRMVAMTLSVMGEPAVPYLLPLLSHPDEDLRAEAIVALISMMPPPKAALSPVLSSLLDNSDTPTKWWVMRVFTAIGGPPKSALPLLISGLRDKDRFYVASEALAAMGDDAKDAVPELVRLLDQFPPHWIEEETEAWENIDKECLILEQTPAQLVKNRIDQWRITLIETLGKIGPSAQAALSHIQMALNDENDQLRAACIPALTGLAYPLPISKLKELIHDKNAYVRRAAFEEIGRRGPPFAEEVISILLFEVKDPDSADILAQIGQPALLALIEALNHPDKNIRSRASRAIYLMQPPAIDAVDALQRALADTETVASAARALVSIGTPEAYNAVTALLKHADPKIRQEGAGALVGAQSPPKIITGPLIAVLGDNDETVHLCAMRVLRKIGTTEALEAVDKIELGLN